MILKKSPLAEAQIAEKSFVSVLVIYALVPFLWMAYILTARPKGSLGPDILIAVVAILIAIGALFVARISISIAVRQMEQAENLVKPSTDSDLAAAINKLMEELGRRPDVSSSVVTFSVFGPSSLTRPAQEGPISKDGIRRDVNVEDKV